MTKIKLTETQHTVLSFAVHNNGGIADRFPPKVKGGAAKKVQNSLVAKGLTRIDKDFLPRVTDEGYRAIGEEPPAPETKTEPAEETKPARKTRKGTKQARVIEMLQRPEGATLEQIAEATGWKLHSARGFLAGTVKKKLGLELTTNRHRIVGPNQVGSPGSYTTYFLAG